MNFPSRLACLWAAIMLSSCVWPPIDEAGWRSAVDRQVSPLGYRNWIVEAEASSPPYNRIGVRKVQADVEIPETLDHVLHLIERIKSTRPHVHLARELRPVESDYAQGVKPLREHLTTALRGHEPTQICHQSLLHLLEDANRSLDVLVIRAKTELPYSSIYLELLPGSWESGSEARLRERENAWIGDAVLELLARRFVLRGRGVMNGEWFTLLTSNDFPSAFGNPTRIEASIGELYQSQGLGAALAWMDAEPIRDFRRRLANRRSAAAKHKLIPIIRHSARRSGPGCVGQTHNTPG